MMQNSLRPAIDHQINYMVVQHMAELAQYVTLREPYTLHMPPTIVADFEQLLVIYNYPAETAPFSVYETVRSSRSRLRSFFKLMNQSLDIAFADTDLGYIWVEAEKWCKTAVKHSSCRPMSDVWHMIAPVQPDSIQERGDGVYEARWWKPVPMMDIELLLRTDGINTISEPYEPDDLSGGLAVRFTISFDN